MTIVIFCLFNVLSLNASHILFSLLMLANFFSFSNTKLVTSITTSDVFLLELNHYICNLLIKFLFVYFHTIVLFVVKLN